MKKKTIFITLAIIAALAGIAFFIYKKRNEASVLIDKYGPDAGNSDEPKTWDNATASERFAQINANLLLNAYTVSGVEEITALQKLMNSYSGHQVVNVNGIFDEQTALALKGITGTESTVLYSFLKSYYLPRKGDNAARSILKGMLNNKVEQGVIDQMLADIKKVQ